MGSRAEVYTKGEENTNLDENVLEFKPIPKPEKLGTNGLPPIDNWLLELEMGTVFLVGHKHYNEEILLQFEITFKTEKAVRLLSKTNQDIHLWVDPIRFCNKYSLMEILGIRKGIEEYKDD